MACSDRKVCTTGTPRSRAPASAASPLVQKYACATSGAPSCQCRARYWPNSAACGARLSEESSLAGPAGTCSTVTPGAGSDFSGCPSRVAAGVHGDVVVLLGQRGHQGRQPLVLPIGSGLRGLAERVPLQCDQGNLHWGAASSIRGAHAVRHESPKRQLDGYLRSPGQTRKISMASTPLRPRQTAWGRACVVDTASNITPKRTAANPPRAGRRPRPGADGPLRPARSEQRCGAAAGAGARQQHYGDNQATAGLRLP